MIEVNCYVYDILRLVFWSEVKGGIEVVIVVAGHVGPDEDPADQSTEITQTAAPSPPSITGQSPLESFINTSSGPGAAREEQYACHTQHHNNNLGSWSLGPRSNCRALYTKRCQVPADIMKYDARYVATSQWGLRFRDQNLKYDQKHWG